MNAVEVRELWKGFRHYQDKAPGLKERVIFWGRERVDIFWALKDINLEIPQGSTIGLIGRNGSGKSTLLKTISRILYPNKGQIKVKGRISTLLELGAGFHPDFTGRENVYLNASILGLSHSQIEERFDSIVAFSELENFIDDPVRNYSSGMYMRLGFAVAVHTDPDILLIDEVLAVGDMAFQEKCMQKIREIQAQGKTIIFVTHSPKQVVELCDQAVWLENGEVKMKGEAKWVTDAFVESMK
jgi:lipopolysaccharide transport system ATP-binding protein